MNLTESANSRYLPFHKRKWVCTEHNLIFKVIRNSAQSFLWFNDRPWRDKHLTGQTLDSQKQDMTNTRHNKH